MAIELFRKHDRTIRTLLSIVIGISVIASWAWMASYENAFINYSRAPDTATGRVVAYRVKSIVVYISPEELRQVKAAHAAFAASIAAGVVVAVIASVIGKRNKPEPSV